MAVSGDEHICHITAAVGRCEVGGAHASPQAGHAVALEAKLNPDISFAKVWAGYKGGAGQAFLFCKGGSQVSKELVS